MSGLKSSVVRALASAKLAMGDLVIECQLVRKSFPQYVPGTAYAVTETSLPLGLVFVKYESKEIDGDRIQADDWKGLSIVDESVPDIRISDQIRVPALTDCHVRPGNYAIGFNDKVTVGGLTVLHQLNLRFDSP